MTHNPNEPRGENLAEQFANDSRAMEARMLPDKGPLNEEQIQHVIDRIDQRIMEDDITCLEIDAQLKAARGSTSQFRLNKYPHDDSNFARRLDRWMNQLELGVGGMPTQMVSMKVADRMIGVLRQIKTRQSMGSIVGPSGVSKSTVRKACVAGLITGCMGFELTETDRTMTQVLRRLTIDLGGPRTISAQMCMQWLKDRLTGTGILLIIDEAHYLERRAMNALRDLHKATGCPIALMGTNDLLQTIDDFNEFHGQMKSLFSINYNITVEANASGTPLYTVDEIMKYAKEMNLRINITGAGEVTDLANTLGWGGLRAAAYLLLNAATLSKGKLITERHVLSALRQMEGADGFQRTKAKSEFAKKTAVA